MTDPNQELNSSASTTKVPDAWESPQRILVVLAHPDDPEFFCGATIARWTAAGHQVVYFLLTCGDKGSADRSMTSEKLCKIRHAEQQAAAVVLGVHEVNFLGYPDGYLTPDLALRKEITRMIRQVRPDVLVTCDPTTLYVGENRLNHPDHRAAGQAALDAVFPPARDFLYFPDLLEEGLEPHNVREVWISGSLQPNIRLDVTDLWETKIRALYEHKSQIGDPQKLAERMRARLALDATPEAPRYEETFRRIIFL
ncbi:MAG: PIG-L family deacetylase [Anaerolineales bacterium]|jgi:LmbE family N-acetylglucosaminyl deacetylase|nr:PIG-L family deacetylase [Anaerolineales bacterium]